MKRETLKSNYLEILESLSNTFEAPPVIPTKVIQSIQAGAPINDIDFDQIYPPRIRALSDVQWSSIKVARHIADMIGKDSTARFVDIGSGVGKLCILLSLLTELEIYGIEQREDLFKIAQTVINENHLNKVHLTCDNMLSLDWSQYDIFYLYNPFQEHLCGVFEGGLIDRNIDLEGKYFAQYISEVFRQMTWLEPGKRVIIFHGYGGIMPPSMTLLESRRLEKGELCLWEKTNEKT